MLILGLPGSGFIAYRRHNHATAIIAA